MNKNFLLNKFQTITDIEGKSVVNLGLIESIEINEQDKRIYVMLKHHKEADFFETRIRDIIKEEGYDAEIEGDLRKDYFFDCLI